MFSFLKRSIKSTYNSKTGEGAGSKFDLSQMSEITGVRSSFPILSDLSGQLGVDTKSSKDKFIYVDNACVSLRPQIVIDTISEYYTKYSACAGRSNHKLSRELDIKINVARSSVAKLVGAKYADEIIFTRNATEAINLVANSISFAAGDIVLTSHKEHNSNLVPWLNLVKQKGIIHNIIPPNSDDTFSIEKLDEALTNAKNNGQNVKLVSLCHVSNLDGSSIDLGAVVKCVHKHGAQILIDGCQAVGHIPVELHALGVDYYAFSAHKMCGPSGMGALYVKLNLQESLSQFLVGGQTVSQTTYTSFVAQTGPAKFEAGLQDYAGILGFGAACDYLRGIGVSKIESHVVALNEYLTTLLRDEIVNGKIKLLGPQEANKRGGIFSFVVPQMSQTEFASMLDKTYGIAVRGGQHCVHSWFNAHMIDGSVRVSFYFYNTAQEVEVIASAIKSLLHLNSLDDSSESEISKETPKETPKVTPKEASKENSKNSEVK